MKRGLTRCFNKLACAACGSSGPFDHPRARVCVACKSTGWRWCDGVRKHAVIGGVKHRLCADCSRDRYRNENDAHFRACSGCMWIKPIDNFQSTSRLCDECRAFGLRWCPMEKHVVYKTSLTAGAKDSCRGCLRARSINRHGLTVREYMLILAKQKFRCAIPGCDSSQDLVIDHDHSCCAQSNSCGECIRGLLCSNCNVAVGMIGDCTKKLSGMIKYLTAYSVKCDVDQLHTAA